VKVTVSILFVFTIGISDVKSQKVEIKDKIVIKESEALIAEVSNIDISKEGKVLITDKISNRVWLFSPEGNLIKELNPKKCSPGFNMVPIDAQFLGKNKIIMSNSGVGGHLFGSNGECIDNLNRKFSAPKIMYASEDGKIYGYYYKSESDRFISKIDEKGNEIEKYQLGEAKFPGLEYRYVGGGVLDTQEKIFFSNSTSYMVSVIDKESKNTERIGKRPKKFNRVESDLPRPGSDPRGIVLSMRSKKEKTLVRGLFKLSGDKIMLVYKNKKGYLSQILTMNGRKIYESKIEGRPFVYAGYGKIVKIFQPEMDNEGKVPNPIIEIYEYKE
jgi:hypothetical protein